jgi:phosphohistidine phosphatase
MRIYLARHGDALSKQENPERPLSETGRKEVAHVADILEQIGAGVDQIVHSDKPRTRQTAEILAQSVLWEAELETAPDMNPNDPVEPWVEKLADLTEDTMLVGHLPFLGRLATRLILGGDESAVIKFPSGTVACLERTDEGRWLVVAVITPGL